MGIADRQYHQIPPQMPRQPSRLDGAPVIKWLLIINVGIFLVDLLLDQLIKEYGFFSIATVFKHGQVWRFITFQFLHANLGHVAFNMFALYMFGAFVEQWWGSRKFLVFYLLCGCSGALFYTILYQIGIFGKEAIDLGGGMTIPSEYIPLVGASAGIYGCLVAVAVIAPNLRIQLFFPPIPMQMKTFAMIILGFAVVMTFSNAHNAGGEAGHLGGAILGFILMKNPQWLNWAGGAFQMRGRGRKVLDAQVVRERKMRPRTHINLNDTDVDQILDKVSREGFQSLTEKEKTVLKKAAEE